VTVLRADAPGKVNLALFLGSVRASDGRHDLVTLIESVSLVDCLTLTDALEDEVVCPGVPGPNLAGAALAALRAAGWDGPPVRISIAKRVPIAGGMGGGSGDAAAALRLACAVSPLPAGVDLYAVAAALGSDVPSQLTPGVTLGTGAGEEVAPVPALPEHSLVVVPSSVPQPTGPVFAEADRLGIARSPEELGARAAALDAWLTGEAREPELVNDLERACLSLRPDLQATLDAVRAAGADRAFITGSGPTVIGLFRGAPGAARAEAAAAALAHRHPGTVVARPVGAAAGAVRPTSAAADHRG
jgi:4-diphosphocytidyl-2-C-methyl-D-erythritol kinase